MIRMTCTFGALHFIYNITSRLAIVLQLIMIRTIQLITIHVHIAMVQLML